MRIAILTNNRLPPREGVARHVLETARRFAMQGHKPVVIARGDGDDWERDREDGVEIHRWPNRWLPPLHHLAARNELQRWFDDNHGGFDLAHVHLPLIPPLRTHLPTIVTVHSPMRTDAAAIVERGLKPILLKLQARLVSARMEQAWFDRADHVTCVSLTVADELYTHYEMKGRAVRIVRNGVDTAFFGAVRRHREPFVLYVGRLSWRKGIHRLIDAFADVPEDFAETLMVVGEGPLRANLERRVEANGLGRRVRFCGFADRETLRDLLSRAACFVNPADYESGPLTLLEAMAAGTPVVTTRTGLVAEFADDVPLTIAQPSAPDLARKLCMLLSDPHAADRRAGAAQTMIRRRFDWDEATRSYLELYGAGERIAA